MTKIIIEDLDEFADLNEEVLRKTTGGIRLFPTEDKVVDVDIRGLGDTQASTTPHSPDQATYHGDGYPAVNKRA